MLARNVLRVGRRPKNARVLPSSMKEPNFKIHVAVVGNNPLLLGA